MKPPAPPPRPAGVAGWLGVRLFRALAPRLVRLEPVDPPASLEPWQRIAIARRRGRGHLSGLWFPGPREPRGTVLLLHPWVPFGQSYFFRRGRIEALRAAGYAVLTVDLPGFGESGPPTGFFDADVEDAVEELLARARDRPAHLWGISSGGYWAHPVLARRSEVASAVFEDVSHHLLEWSWRTAPWGRPFYLVFRHLLPGSYRFLDLRLHAPHLQVRSVAYIGGGRDVGARPDDTRALAAVAGGEALIVEDAGHLGAIKMATEEVIGLALRVFAR